VSHRIRVVASFNFLTAAVVLVRVRFRVTNHTIDFFLRKLRSAGDGDFLLLARIAILCRDREGTFLISSCTSEYLRPMNRFTE
jgi:hypothetical protein